jgi:molybdate transport system substrate-binding protein
MDMNKKSIILIITLILVLSIDISAQSDVFIYSAAGLMKPMEEISKNFEEETDINVNIQFNASGVLMNQIKTVKQGDIYIAADSWYVNQLFEQNIITKRYRIAKHTPVIIVPNKNKNSINNFNDILLSGKKIIIADKSAAIGKVTQEIFEKNEISEDIQKNIISNAETVNKVKMYILLNQADAGIVWKANYFENREELQMVKIPEENNIIKDISIGKLKYSTNPEKSERFLNYITSQKGKEIFQKYGYNNYKEKVK